MKEPRTVKVVGCPPAHAAQTTARTLSALERATTIRDRIDQLEREAAPMDDRLDLPFSILVPPREPVRLGCPLCCSTRLSPASVRDGYYCGEGHLMRLWFEVDRQGVVLEVMCE